MNRKLKQIARRRAELVSRAERGRESLAGNRLWVSVPVLVAELFLDSWRVMSFRSSIGYNVAGVLYTVLPKITLRLADRGLKIWMNTNRKWKELLK